MLCNTKFSGLLASVTIALALISTPLAATSPDIVPSGPKNLPVIHYLDNGKQDVLKPRGARLTALHFWSTWCVPCLAELPEIDETQKAYEARGFRVVALSLDSAEAVQKVVDFFAEHRITTLKPYIDKDLKAFQSVKGRGLPTTIFIDESGMEIARSEGAVDWKDKANLDFIEMWLEQPKR